MEFALEHFERMVRFLLLIDFGFSWLGNRILVEQLARVNPIQLSCDEKLAFWINLYNALIMHVSFLHSV